MIELLSLTSQLKSGRDTFNQLYKEYYRKAYLLDNILVSEAESIISKTLSTFSDQTQNIFHLSRIDGLSNAEIASKIGLSEKGVEYHISKVLKTLRISLKDFLFFLILISLGRSFF